MAEEKSHGFCLPIFPIRCLERRLFLLNRATLALQVALALFGSFLFHPERRTDFDRGVKGIDTALYEIEC